MFAASATAQSPTVKLSLDSAFLLMGRTTPLHLELVAPANPEGRLLIPKDSMCDKVEILELLKADTTQLGNDRIEVKQDIVLQSFDSGVYRMNPIMYVVGNDTFRSNRLVLKVYPADVDSLETIHDYADVADVDRSFIDYLPDFIVDYGLWILALIIVLGGGATPSIFSNARKIRLQLPLPSLCHPTRRLSTSSTVSAPRNFARAVAKRNSTPALPTFCVSTFRVASA